MSTNCIEVRREIDEIATDELLSGQARRHVNGCAQCSAFEIERQKIREMVASLGTVEAPADFDFKLRAKIAASNSSPAGIFSGNAFSARAAAFASLILAVGLVAVLMNGSSLTTSTPVAVSNAPAAPAVKQAIQPTAVDSSTAAITNGEVAAVLPARNEGQRTQPARSNSGRSVSSQFVARSGRIKATDLSATPARVWRPADGSNGSVFPLNASYQSLKVAVDDGRGTSRTISLPTVSFGSSHAVAQNPTPVMASMRDSW